MFNLKLKVEIFLKTRLSPESIVMKTTGRQLWAEKGIFMNIYELSKWPLKLSWEEETTRSRPKFPLYLFFCFLYTCLRLSCLLSHSCLSPLSPVFSLIFLTIFTAFLFFFYLSALFRFLPFSSSSLPFSFLVFSLSNHAPLWMSFLPFSLSLLSFAVPLLPSSATFLTILIF